MGDKTESSSTKSPWTQWMSGFQNLTQGPASQIYKEWEGWLSSQLEKVARSDTFLSQMARTLEGSFQMKANLDRMLDTSIRAMRLPSASDLESVQQRLDAVERRLDTLLEKLEKLEKAETAAGKRGAKSTQTQG